MFDFAERIIGCVGTALECRIVCEGGGSIREILAMLLLAGSLAALVVAVVADVEYWIVPNRIVIIIAAAGLAIRLLVAPGQIWFSLAAAGTILAVLGFLSGRGWIGAGDAKLITATSLLVSSDRVPLLLIAIVAAGGAVSCGYLAAWFATAHLASWRRRPQEAGSEQDPAHAPGHEQWRHAVRQPIPYSLAVLGGVALHITGEVYRCVSANAFAFA